MPRYRMSTSFYQDSKGELIVLPTLMRWAGTLCLLGALCLLLFTEEYTPLRIGLAVALVLVNFLLKKLARPIAQKAYDASLEQEKK